MAAVEITQIKQTKKGRCALFCAQGFLFSVDEDTLVRFELRKGSVLDDAQMDELVRASDRRRAESRAMDLLGVRDHAERELIRKLERHFDADTARAAATRMVELGLIDDRRFAQRFAEELLRKGKSLRETEQKLTERGVGRALAKEILEGFEREESAAVRALIDRKYRTRLQKPDGYRAVAAALARRGFSAGDIRAALEDFKNSAGLPAEGEEFD